MAGLAPGLLATAILVVNNLRDIASDRAAGKKSLAVRFGRGFARGEYLVCMVGGSLIPVLLVGMVDGHVYALGATVLCLILAAKHMRVVFTATDGPTLNATLAATAKVLMVYAVVFSAGWLAS